MLREACLYAPRGARHLARLGTACYRSTGSSAMSSCAIPGDARGATLLCMIPGGLRGSMPSRVIIGNSYDTTLPHVISGTISSIDVTCCPSLQR
ncbi:hypothetical protein BHE74_00037210 [Ensete ventricosum]|nr:hypothetical protein BHE74_00037210 [Ensete ventricosum]